MVMNSGGAKASNSAPCLTSQGGMAGAPGDTGAFMPRTARNHPDDLPKGGGGAPVSFFSVHYSRERRSPRQRASIRVFLLPLREKVA
jgi:hypothetical protein